MPSALPRVNLSKLKHIAQKAKVGAIPTCQYQCYLRNQLTQD